MFIWSQIAKQERERERSCGDESYYTWKIVPYKCYLPIFLTNVTHFQLLYETFIENGQNVNKHDIPWMKLFCEKFVAFMYPMWLMMTKENDM